MDSGFHLRTVDFPTFYQRRQIHSIRGISHPALALCALILLCAPVCGALGEPQTGAPRAHDEPSGGAKPPAGGFAPVDVTLFAPLLALVPPGPGRAARAASLFERQAGFYRRFVFHPSLSPELQKVDDQMPPRGATLLTAARLYARTDIPWQRGVDGAHTIRVVGAAEGPDYLFALAAGPSTPIQPNQFLSAFSLRPVDDDAPGAAPSSVIGTLDARLRLDGYDPHSAVDLPAAMLRECYGGLRGPWDAAPGKFNRHDRAALDRFRSQMPALYAALRPYLHLNNVLDEFASPDGTPLVLVNLDAQILPQAFVRFPHFAAFYGRIAPRVDVTIGAENRAGGQWARVRFDRSHLQVVFMDSDGMLRPFDSHLAPAGPAIAPDALIHGSYRITMRLHYTRFEMTFGLDDLTFTTDYRREPDGLRFVTRMPAPPTLVAPPVVRQVIRMLAERFMATMAQGDGGMKMTFDSYSTGDNRSEVAARWRAELTYSPMLKVLVRVADAIADAHNQAVRDDERRMGEELFDALLRDYNSAKPRLLALDRPDAAR